MSDRNLPPPGGRVSGRHAWGPLLGDRQGCPKLRASPVSDLWPGLEWECPEDQPAFAGSWPRPGPGEQGPL